MSEMGIERGKMSKGWSCKRETYFRSIIICLRTEGWGRPKMRDWEVKERKTQNSNMRSRCWKENKSVEEVIRLLGECDCGNELPFYYYLKLFLNLKVKVGSPRLGWVTAQWDKSQEFDNFFFSLYSTCICETSWSSCRCVV